MVWFNCNDCGDSIKKPKLVQHFHSCAARSFTCIDCSCTYDRNGAQAHNACVTEHEKYALGATKPGGYAANGFANGSTGGTNGGPANTNGPVGAPEARGLEYLSTRPPWKCSICNVNCTSRETLTAHATGVKHLRRVKAAATAAATAANGGVPISVAPPSNGMTSDAVEPAAKRVKRAASSSSSSSSSDDSDAAASQQKKKAVVTKAAVKQALKKVDNSSSSSSSSSSDDSDAAPKRDITAVPAVVSAVVGLPAANGKLSAKQRKSSKAVNSSSSSSSESSSDEDEKKTKAKQKRDSLADSQAAAKAMADAAAVTAAAVLAALAAEEAAVAASSKNKSKKAKQQQSVAEPEQVLAAAAVCTAAEGNGTVKSKKAKRKSELAEPQVEAVQVTAIALHPALQDADLVAAVEASVRSKVLKKGAATRKYLLKQVQRLLDAAPAASAMKPDDVLLALQAELLARGFSSKGKKLVMAL